MGLTTWPHLHLPVTQSAEYGGTTQQLEHAEAFSERVMALTKIPEYPQGPHMNQKATSLAQMRVHTGLMS